MKLLADENFDGDIVRGLLRRTPDLDLVRVQDAGMSETPDPAILARAADEDRILLTHDRNTIPGFAYDRVPRWRSDARRLSCQRSDAKRPGNTPSCFWPSRVSAPRTAGIRFRHFPL